MYQSDDVTALIHLVVRTKEDGHVFMTPTGCEEDDKNYIDAVLYNAAGEPTGFRSIAPDVLDADDQRLLQRLSIMYRTDLDFSKAVIQAVYNYITCCHS